MVLSGVVRRPSVSPVTPKASSAHSRASALVFSVETGTGASVLTTALGGQIHNTLCGPAGISCGFGPTFGPQMGIQPAAATVGAASYVNALTGARTCHNVLEPQQHVVFSPAPPVQIDYNNPFVLSLVLIELVGSVVPSSVFW